IRMSVVLPAPLGPTRPMRSPVRTSNFSSEKTGSPANCRPRPLADRRIMDASDPSEWTRSGVGSGRVERSLRVAQRPLLPQHVVVVLREAVGLVADVLQEPQR